jgi:small-conductance mechanosensitive channel
VGVAYDADPDQVIAILQKCADDHPQVLRSPQPRAVFDAFGASALDFSLLLHLSDISQAMGVQSELRTAILKALRAGHVDIPGHRGDVNLRAVDGIRHDLAQLAPERAAARSGQPRPAAVSVGSKGAASEGSKAS